MSFGTMDHYEGCDARTDSDHDTTRIAMASAAIQSSMDADLFELKERIIRAVDGQVDTLTSHDGHHDYTSGATFPDSWPFGD